MSTTQSAVQIRQQEQVKSAWGMLEKLKPSIAQVLPRHLTPARMAMIAFTAMRKNPKLLECSQDSIVGSIMTACMLGLEPSGPLGHGALIPYWNSRRAGGAGYECQFQPMYQGLLDLARRSGFIRDVQLRAVYRGDQYSYCFGLEPDITHVPMDGDGADSPDREPTNVYCIIRLVGGGVQWDQMSYAQGIAHGKRYSPSYDKQAKDFKPGSVWADNPLAMILKTILKVTLKLCPKSPELAAALLSDDLSETGKTTTMKKLDDGVFDVEFGEEPEMETRPNGIAAIVESAKKPVETAPETKSESGPASSGAGVGAVSPSAPAQAASETKTEKRETEPAKAETKRPIAETFGEERGTIDPEAVCTADQFNQLEESRTEHSVSPSLWLKWAKESFGLKRVADLKQKDFARCLAWTRNSGKE